MNIYISGISGTGMGPLALMAKAAGLKVCGTDLAKGAIYNELEKAGIEIEIGAQDGKFLKQKLDDGIDWFVYTSALPKDHAELVMAQEAGIKISKRDEFTDFLVTELKLKMVAVAGTHGKTTTTAMIIWAALQLGLPVSYIVGTTLSFALSGAYKKGDKFFIYEADEYDRNFLKFHPWLAVITSISYDHPDIYPTEEDYKKAFWQFMKQSKQTIEKSENTQEKIKLAGEVRREDAGLAVEAIKKMAPEIAEEEIIEILNNFPGAGRRFEKIAEGVYTDYAHHPAEIEATIKIAQEEALLTGRRGVVAIYQPHQNTRQYEVKDEYNKVFLGVEKVFWLPTFLTRENPDLPILSATDLIAKLENAEVAEPAELDEVLVGKIEEFLKKNYLVILMTAGSADYWFRKKFSKKKY